MNRAVGGIVSTTTLKRHRAAGPLLGSIWTRAPTTTGRRPVVRPRSWEEDDSGPPDLMN